MPVVHNKTIYLDAASTFPTRKEIVSDAAKLMNEYYGNADSLHQAGQRVSRLIETSQTQLAKMLNVTPEEIFYTSGASESNSWAIIGIALANQKQGKHLITSQIEHASSLNAFHYLEEEFGFEVTYLPVNKKGCIELETLRKSLRDDTTLVSLFAVNNEVGSVHPVTQIAQIVKAHSNAYYHVDAVQALAKHEFSLQGVDAISYSAHKIGGLKGSGLLIKRVNTPIHPLIFGGQQQYGLRGGTLNSPAMILWSKTLRLALEESKAYAPEIKTMAQYLYDYFEDKDGIEIHSSRDGSPYIFNLSILNVGSEIMMNGLNRYGIYVASQSTCHSHQAHSHVLSAMGKSAEALHSSIRISLSSMVKLEDIKFVCEKIMEIKNYVQN